MIITAKMTSKNQVMIPKAVPKYVELEKYRVSSLFAAIDCNGIHGTALLQHIRAIDPNARVSGNMVAHLTDSELESIINVIE